MTPDLPVVPCDELPSHEDRGGIVGVVLAAGTSSRFGADNKLLAPVEGDPLVRHATRTLLGAGLETAVVVGHEADRVRKAVAPLAVQVIENPDYAAGQATSVRVGVEWAVASDAQAVVFLPGDMPFVEPVTVDCLGDAYLADAGDALAAAHEGQRGNPVLFGRRHFDALRGVEGDVGGREILLGGEHSALVNVADPGVRRDVDTPADLPDGG